jgi:hypothetical protein
MTMDEGIKRFQLRVSRTRQHAGRYLESKGKRFLIDFGIENCLEVSRIHWRTLKLKRRRKT